MLMPPHLSRRCGGSFGQHPYKSERERTMRKTIRASVLVVVLACSTYAGEIQNGTPGTPQSQPVPVSTAQAPAESTTTGILLTLLGSVLALF